MRGIDGYSTKKKGGTQCMLRSSLAFGGSGSKYLAAPAPSPTLATAIGLKFSKIELDSSLLGT